jgi:molybdopterin-binding protein
VTGCGGTFNANTNTYTTGPITANCNVAATFIQGINVSVPNGGESWLAGTTQTIRWTYSGAVGSFVKIDLYKGGVFNSAIVASASSGTGGNGSYNWPIPANLAPGADYRIKVTSTTNGTLTDISNNNFTIAAPTITVVSPNGGQNWTRGSERLITWTYTGNPGTFVKIELFRGTVLNRTITSSASTGSSGNGSFRWLIPSNQTTGTNFRIRLTSTTNATVTDTSNANFTIR